MSHSKQSSVLLLKAPPVDGEADNYIDILEQAGYKVHFVPIISFNFVDEVKLISLIKQLDNFSAIVFTSQRAVLAIERALRFYKDSSLWERDVLSLPCFAVGQATAHAARSAGFFPVGEESGDAETLANYVANAVGNSTKSVLFPCSQIRKSALSVTLESMKILVEEIVVYETVQNANLHGDLKQLFDTCPLPKSVVFFSTSGVECARKSVQCGILPLHLMNVYAFGPSTYVSLVNDGYTVAGTAIKPTPTCLLNILEQHNVTNECQ